MTTFVRTAGGLYYPQRYQFSGIANTAIISAQSIGIADTDYFGICFTVPKTGTLDGWESKVLLHTSRSSHTLRFGWRAYDDVTGGFSTTVDEVGTTDPAGQEWYSTGLLLKAGVKRSVVAGERLVALIDFTAWTAGLFQAAYLTMDSAEGWPYTLSKVGAGAEIHQAGFAPLFVLKYSDGTYALPQGCHPLSTIVSSHRMSSAREVRQRFTPRFDMECDGCSFHLNLIVDGNPTIFTLYDDAGVSLRTATVASVSHPQGLLDGEWEPITLTSGTFYALSLKGTTADLFQVQGHTNSDTVASLALWGAEGSTAERDVTSGVWTANAGNSHLFGWLHLAGLPVTTPTPGGGGGGPGSFGFGPPIYVRVIAEWVRNEYVISDGLETLGVSYPGVAWRAYGFGCTAFFYETDVDAFTASFSTGIYELDREGTLTDNGSTIVLTVETPSAISDAAVPLRLQRLYVEANTRGQSVVPTLVLDETTLVLASFSNTVRSTVEYALDTSSRTVGVRLSSTTLVDRIDVFGVDVDYYVPEGDPDATFTIPEQPMMMDA